MDKLMLKLIGVFALLASVGCDPFDPGSLLRETRVLGARVEVRGDAERASPRPGETADIIWIVASPDGTPSLRWAFVACIADDLESCSTSPLAFVEGADPVPALSLTVPNEDALGGADRITVLGVVCRAGEPALSDTGQPTCEGDDAAGTPVTFDVHIARSERDENLNPSLEGARVSLAGEPWDVETVDIAMGDCTERDGLPVVRAGGAAREIVLALGPTAREFTVDEASGAPSREALQVSHFVTAGELEGQYSFVEASDVRERSEVRFEWEPPAKDEVPAQGEVVRLVLVVRDLRGGISSTERALCVRR